jgi:4-hydroxy-tetrahydrodipicolinate reductase
MIKILMSGCSGKMGQVISSLVASDEAVKIVGGFDLVEKNNDYPVFADPWKCDIEADVIIDFSHPSAFEGLTAYARDKKIPLVMCTTGLSKSQIEELDIISKDIPVFFSANMSLGVNLLIDLVKKAAKFLENNFDIEIVEKHHNQKIDAPSGTALAIADSINSVLNEKQEYIYDRHSRRKKRSPKEIGIHAVRGGTIVGDHSVIFAGNDEIIEINHMAMSKDIFAVGALRAAKYLANQTPGLYGMSEMLE